MTDSGLFLHVNTLSRHTAWLHPVARAYAVYGVVLFIVLLAISGLVAWRSRRLLLVARAGLAPLAVLVAVGLNQPLGHLVHERRPYDQLSGVLVLLPRSADFSFPSDHAVMAGAVSVGVLLVSLRLGLLTVVAGVLLAADRVYTGVHFPLDVLAGLAFGALVCWCLIRLLAQPTAAAVGSLLPGRWRTTPLHSRPGRVTG